jgi:hypothetical protein
MNPCWSCLHHWATCEGNAHQRRTARTTQTASTAPKGQAPLKNPYTLDRAHPRAKANTKMRPLDSSPYIAIMNVSATTPNIVNTPPPCHRRRHLASPTGDCMPGVARHPLCLTTARLPAWAAPWPARHPWHLTLELALRSTLTGTMAISISELADRLKMSTDTLRYYERLGLVPAARAGSLIPLCRSGPKVSGAKATPRTTPTSLTVVTGARRPCRL